MAEFTGERVIPGLVDQDLLNEHLARYRFARTFTDGAEVLDAGCGSGYGVAELRNARLVTAFDVSADAVEYAARNFARPGVRFMRASCEALPFQDRSFDVVTAFEVIEHLERWQDLLLEARRVLKDGGVLLVSTPNRRYYAEMRAKAGPNPFHCHEFDYEEYQEALQAVFTHVEIWTQNHASAIVFAPREPEGAELSAGGERQPESAHFYFAACSQEPIAKRISFVWLPSASNVLRERELHIAKLEGEIARKDRWLEELKSAHAELHRLHEVVHAEMNERSQKAADDAAERMNWIGQLQITIREGEREIERLRVREAELEKDLVERTDWARGLNEEAAALTRALADRADELAAARRQLALIAQSRWVRFGRSMHIGPDAGPAAGE